MDKAMQAFNKNLWSGLLLIVMGIAVAIHARSLEIGSLNQMGPGYFPLALGIILMLVGAVLAAQNLRVLPTVAKAVVKHPPEWKAWFLICLSLVAFVLLAQHFGLVAGTFAIVFISALGDRDNTVVTSALLALAMVAVAVIVFWWALQVQLPLFRIA